MTGFTGYVYAIQHFDKGQVFAGAILMICSGAAFGTATMVRSNGILSGIPFLYEAIVAMLSILFRGPSGVRFTRLASVIIAGLVVASGMAYPQILAHKDYCSGRDVGTRRPWCERTIPSIFTWVQSHYWCVDLNLDLTMLTRISGTWAPSVTGHCPTCHCFSWRHRHWRC